jgi:hypothetical protein
MLSLRILIVVVGIADLPLATALRRRGLNRELAKRAARTPSLRLSSQRRQGSWRSVFSSAVSRACRSSQSLSSALVRASALSGRDRTPSPAELLVM